MKREHFYCPPIALFVALVFCVIVGVFATGCGQQTSSPLKQNVEQSTPTPVATDQNAATQVATDQNAATQGSTVNVYVVNAPGKSTLPNTGGADFVTGDGASASFPAETANCENAAGGNSVATAKAGYQQSAITVNVTTGGTAPSLTGTASGAPSLTGTASGAPTVSGTANPNLASYPTQHIQPEASVSMPIAVGMPGSSQSQQSAATGRGTSGDPSQTNANPANYTSIRATPDQIQKAIELLSALKQQQAATTQPATTPALIGN